ncbi:HNH endonuclease [Novosphingobium sp. FSW06-99]|uniref:HNH endonuclease n=1 Tax=Novosphingobium sp. FSW06-99 TaxID=1739113 RepID=UPI0012E39436|nr:HNH endonuclease [Novosphingobium sp. FSW06-99]
MILETLARYWAKVDRRGDDECWNWKGARTSAGYGQISSGSSRRNRPLRVLATHVSLAVSGRARPSSGHLAMHSCDNPLCVNPHHLEWGTQMENMADMVAKERSGPQRRAAALMDDAAIRMGRGSGLAKLNEAAVRYIRSSEKTTLDLAAELNVTNQCISAIRLRKTWRHVP